MNTTGSSLSSSNSHSLSTVIINDINILNKMKDMKKTNFTVSSEDSNNDGTVSSTEYSGGNKEGGHTEGETNDEGHNNTKEQEIGQQQTRKQQTRKQHGTRRGAKSLIPNQRHVDYINTTFDKKKLTSLEVINLELYHQSTIKTSLLFPVKLQILLKIAEELGFQHIISWLPHGRAFIIHRPYLFEKQVMGKFLSAAKVSSFKRQLNLYDFKRIQNGIDTGAYYHEMFLRSKPVLAMKMVRRKIKGQIRVSTFVQKVPQFYSMPFLGSIFFEDRNTPQKKKISSMSNMITKGRVVNTTYSEAGTEDIQSRSSFLIRNMQSEKMMSFPSCYDKNMSVSSSDEEQEFYYPREFHCSCGLLHSVPQLNLLLNNYRSLQIHHQQQSCQNEIGHHDRSLLLQPERRSC